MKIAKKTVSQEFVTPTLKLAPLPATNITVIGFNDVIKYLPDASVPHDEQYFKMMDLMTQAIPFFGQVLGFGYIGHNVMCFEGNPLAFRAGIKGAEILVVDGEMTRFLPDNWMDIAELELVGRRRLLIFQRNGELNTLEFPPKKQESTSTPSTSEPDINEPKAPLDKAMKLAKEEQYEEALSLFDTLRTRSPKDMTVVKYRAAVLLRLKKYPEALQEYELYMRSQQGKKDPDRQIIKSRIRKLRRI